MILYMIRINRLYICFHRFRATCCLGVHPHFIFLPRVHATSLRLYTLQPTVVLHSLMQFWILHFSCTIHHAVIKFLTAIQHFSSTSSYAVFGSIYFIAGLHSSLQFYIPHNGSTFFNAVINSLTYYQTFRRLYILVVQA